MVSAAPASPATRRALILRDSLAFLALLAVSVALFGVTLFLFRSFEQRRVDLAVRWAERGRAALEQGRPVQAITSLRIALSYTPDGPDARADQLLLAQALAAAGHTDEANNYFLNLWDAHPGDGFINLQLARLARQRDEDHAADDYYRASIFGSWEGDGVVRRRQVRLELSGFLIQQHLNAEARNELFTLAGNAPNDPQVDLTVARNLSAAGYLPDALTFYQRATEIDPHNRSALAEAGQAAYTLGDFAAAERLLDRALEVTRDQPPAPDESSSGQQQLIALAGAAKRIQQLTLTPDQPATTRAVHLLEAAKIAETRLHACSSTLPQTNSSLDDLQTRWTFAQSGSNLTRRNLLDDPTAPDSLAQLIFLTEQNTAASCGAPAGDDALILELANLAAKGQGSNGR